MIRLKRAMALSAILCVLAPAAVRADIVITATDVTIGPGDVGTMDFSITSTTSDTLSAFGLELLITPASTATSILQFTTTQPDPYNDPNYVFAGQSFGGDNGVPFWSGPSGNPFTTILAGDFSDSSTGYVSIAAAGSYLGSVEFQAAPGASLRDSFQISLVNDPNFTYFDDQNGNPLNYSLNGGTVTVGDTAVPEPSSLALAALPAICGLLLYTRRRATCL